LHVNLWPILILLIELAMPSLGHSNAQIYDIQDNRNHITINNASNPVGNITQNPSSQSVNNTGMSNANTNNIVINEIELNPPGGDSDREWVELYNPTNAVVNISGFEIRTSFKPATIQLPSDAVIESNGTYVVGIVGQLLSNTAESLVLAKASGEIVGRTPSLVDRSDDGRTWQRIPDGNDLWQFAAGTMGELNDPGEQASAAPGAGTGAALQCLGTTGCAEGTVTRIVDGDTLYVNVNGTTYKIDLALTMAPSSNESGFIESTSFTRSLCLGSRVLVDQDDKLLTSDTSIIAVIYCGFTNLNSELLDNGYATLDFSQCKTSEFADQPWAREHGC
jgi:endonuclease YncB( thermonuclease family)